MDGSMMGNRDVERLADDIDKDRRITTATYCGNCGYNLRALPYLYNCPECGSEYNARPLVMKGIYLPYHVRTAWTETAAVAFCAYVVFLMVKNSLPSFDADELAWMSPAVILGLIYLRLAIRGWVAWFKAQVIARRVEREAREEG